MAVKYDTELYLTASEAAAYMNYLVCSTASLSGGDRLFLGLGAYSNGVFTEITPTAANGYGRWLVNRPGDDPSNLITVTGRTLTNHKQIVFPKCISEGYEATALGLFRAETGGSAFAAGPMSAKLTAVPGSMPMFNIDELQMKIADGTEAE